LPKKSPAEEAKEKRKAKLAELSSQSMKAVREAEERRRQTLNAKATSPFAQPTQAHFAKLADIANGSVSPEQAFGKSRPNDCDLQVRADADGRRSGHIYAAAASAPALLASLSTPPSECNSKLSPTLSKLRSAA
jgi:hypothetical protein